MTTDPDPAADVPRWYLLASLAYLRIVRYLMLARVVSPRRALLLTAPWHEAAARAGMRLPARFYQAAADAGLELPGALTAGRALMSFPSRPAGFLSLPVTTASCTGSEAANGYGTGRRSAPRGPADAQGGRGPDQEDRG